MIHTMVTTMDAAGRLVIPREDPPPGRPRTGRPARGALARRRHRDRAAAAPRGHAQTQGAVAGGSAPRNTSAPTPDRDGRTHQTRSRRPARPAITVAHLRDRHEVLHGRRPSAPGTSTTRQPRPGIERRLDRGERMAIAAHALVETYAVLTRLPAPHRLAPADAWALVKANFVKRAAVVALTGAAHTSLPRRVGRNRHRQVVGLYDAVIAASARQGRSSARS